MNGKLSIIGTPIGNSKDVTIRALETLKSCDVIVCEDTKTTKKLLSLLNIENKKLESFHSHSDTRKLQFISQLLQKDLHLAYVSDAGTPGISDPGPYLVREIQKTLPNIKIEVVPGPDSVSASLSGAGVVFKEYIFLGFIPQKKGRKTFLEKLKNIEYVTVFFESSHRIKKLLTELSMFLYPEQEIVVAKEITKIHEKFFRGTPSEISILFKNDSKLEKGEFVIIVTQNHN